VLKIDFLLPKGLKYHVFLTHGSEKDEKAGRDTVERVSRVNASLRDLGFSTRFDGERMATKEAKMRRPPGKEVGRAPSASACLLVINYQVYYGPLAMHPAPRTQHPARGTYG
jgi:hypothetical protein